MLSFESQLNTILQKRESASVQVLTLGNFEVWHQNKLLTSKDWGRDKAIQLFQFLVTARHRKALHKAQILDRLWEEDEDTGDQTFKVALHGINKALEPSRKSHSEAHFISRIGLTYKLNSDDIWIDSDAFEKLIALANQLQAKEPENAQSAYFEAINLYQGDYLPDRLYEDWSCDERERLQILALGAIINLAEMLVETNPLESIRLCQQALLIDITWEEAYRIQMEAYFHKGNRPMAIKTYQHCEAVLKKEMGIQPLPETKKIYAKILNA